MHNIFATFSFPCVAEKSGSGIGTGKVGVFSIFVVIFDEYLKYWCTYEFLYFFLHLFYYSDLEKWICLRVSRRWWSF